jgi:uncharacterized protein YndB with AHSA1/START domain
MSIRLQVSHRFSASPERVFRALTELDRAGDWMPGHVRVERLGGDGFDVGTQWRETRKVFGREATEQFEVTEMDPPRRLGLRVDGSKGASKRGEYLFTYRLTPRDGGTDVVLDGEIRGLGKIRELFGRLMAGPFRKMIEKDMKAMDDYLKRTAPEPAGTA